MLSPRWHKVLRDLWGYKARTMLVVISVAVGVFAVGMIAGTQVILGREMNAAWYSIKPANASVYSDPFDEDMIWTVRNLAGVRDAGARDGIASADTASRGDRGSSRGRSKPMT